MLNPWDKAPVVSDDPGAKIINLHRSVVPLAPYRAARATRDNGMQQALETRRTITPPPPELLEQVRREDAAFNRLTYAERMERLNRTPLYTRTYDWLEDTYSVPLGFLWFAGTLLPILIAALCVGYFGWELAR